jgi:hypothetical protein
MSNNKQQTVLGHKTSLVAQTLDSNGNKQQTAMKLYTEEEIKRGLDNPISFDMTTDEFINSLTPIELPNDEELKKQFDVDEFDPYDVAYLGGAMRMRNKIQGGNK